MQSDDIKRLRELLKMTQSQFASELNTSERTIQNWEAGKKIPSTKLDALAKLASKFRGERFFFFDATDSPGAGVGSESKGISSVDLRRILDEMKSQRENLLSEIEKRDSQIDELIAILKSKI